MTEPCSEGISLEGRGEEAIAPVLLEMASALAAEVYPGSRVSLTLDADLMADVGLDSLGRAELISRVQSRFGVNIAEAALAQVASLRDLLDAVLEASPDSAVVAAIPPPVPVAVADSPDNVRTLTELLEWRAAADPERVHLYLHEASGQDTPMTFGELLKGAREIATGLRARGLAPDQPVAMMLPTGLDYFITFFGVLLAGGVAVPLYPPASRAQLEDHMRRQEGILDNCQAPILVTMAEVRPLARLLVARVPTLREVVRVAELRGRGAAGPRPQRRPADLALLQYTSGSTGAPKGVMLSHAMLLTNIRIMGETIEATSRDVFVSWLPLYHDMGLIGAWLGSLRYGYTLVVMSPLVFLTRPLRWLQAIHRHRGTISASPNFGYALCLEKVSEQELKSLDLSAWRVAANGAEPVQAKTLERFAHHLRCSGFRESALMPVYGLAEVTLGFAFTPPGRGVLSDRVSREDLASRGRARPVTEDEADSVLVVSCGPALSGYAARVVGEAGEVLGERQVGRLQLRGPSCTTGYYRNVEATEALFDGEWLESGDLGYLAGGEVYVTGRVKELIIRAGRNLYPYELEAVVNTVEGVRKGRVAVFGCPDQKLGTERIVVVAETHGHPGPDAEPLRGKIVAAIGDLLGGPPDDIVLAPPGTVLKTSSGKIRRGALRDLYINGTIGKGVRPWWVQFSSMLAGALPGGLVRVRRRITGGLWGAYAWLAIVLLAVPTWLGVLLLPRESMRRSLARRMSRLLVRVTGLPLSVTGQELLVTPRIVVANHSSYLDAILLTAALPATARFVAKRELLGIPLVGRFLQRIGTVFVERFDPQGGAKDAEVLARSGAAGQILVFFAEGTFQRAPGLLPFRMGAFMTAVHDGTPVLPLGLRGMRYVLPDNVWLPRRGPVEVRVGDPVHPAGPGWSNAIRLRDELRAKVQALSGEPDLELS